MGNAQRKARKRNHEPFVKVQKEPTPAPERAHNRLNLERRAVRLIRRMARQGHNERDES